MPVIPLQCMLNANKAHRLQQVIGLGAEIGSLRGTTTTMGVLASKPRPRPVRDGGRRRRRHQQCRPLTTAGRRQGSTISPYTGTTANHSQTNRADGYGPQAGEQAMTSLPLTVVLAAGGLAEAWRACLAGQRRAGCCFRALGWRCAPAAS